MVPGDRCRPPAPVATTVTRSPPCASRTPATSPASPAPTTTTRLIPGARASSRAGARRRACPGRSSRPGTPGASGRRRGSAPARCQRCCRNMSSSSSARSASASPRSCRMPAARYVQKPPWHGPIPSRRMRRTSSRLRPGRRSAASVSARRGISSHSQMIWSSRRSSRAPPGASRAVVVAALGSGQHLVGGAAAPLVAELLAHRVDDVLGHQAVGGQLAAGDGEEALDAVARGVVDDARPRLMCRVSPSSSEARSSLNSGRAPVQACSARAWRKPGTITSPGVEHLLHLGVPDGEVVGAVGLHVGGADDADGADGDEDVAVAGRVAAVDHRVHQPVVHRDHDPLARAPP